MAKDMSKETKAQVEEVICEASGKVCLSPCQIACPLGEDIQRNHAMIALLPLDLEEAASQIIKIGDEIYEKNPFFLICMSSLLLYFYLKKISLLPALPHFFSSFMA